MKKRKRQQRLNLGKGSIISNSRVFDLSLMENLVVEENVLSEEYCEYCSSFVGITEKIKTRFPLLTFTLLPTNERLLAYIKGDLITADEIEKYGRRTAIKMGITFPIFAVFPLDYQKRGIKIFDACNRIDRSKIEEKYLHMNGKNELCTHKPVDITPENAVIDVLQSAWHLYTEYKKYERTGSFDLICYPHGGNPNER